MDEDAISLFDMKGKAISSGKYAWTSVKRWAAEQNNVFLFNARIDGGDLVDLRLHCDDASAIANACNKGVKLAVAKHKQRQNAKRKEKKLPTVYEGIGIESTSSSSDDEKDSDSDSDSNDDDDDSSASSMTNGKHSNQKSDAQVILRPKVKLLFGRTDQQKKKGEGEGGGGGGVAADKVGSGKSESKSMATTTTTTTTTTSGSAVETTELWTGYLREKSGSRFSIMSSKKKWWVLKSNKKFRAYSVDPASGKKTLSNIFTVRKCTSRGELKNSKHVVIDVEDASVATTRTSKQLSLEAESLDEADKLTRAVVHCLSLQASAASDKTTTQSTSSVPPSPSSKQQQHQHQQEKKKKKPLTPQPPSIKSPRSTSKAKVKASPAVEVAKNSIAQSDDPQSKTEEGVKERERVEEVKDNVDLEVDAEVTVKQREVEEEDQSPSRSNNLKDIRHRNSLLGSSLSSQFLFDDDDDGDGDDGNEEEDDSPIGKEIPDVKLRAPELVAPHSPSTPQESKPMVGGDLGKESNGAKLQLGRLEESHELSQMLIGQLVKRVDYLERDLGDQKKAMQAALAKQAEQQRAPPPQLQQAVVAGGASSPSLESLQQWGEMELLSTRMDKLEFQFDDLKQSFNAMVNDLTSNLEAIRDVLLSTGGAVYGGGTHASEIKEENEEP